MIDKFYLQDSRDFVGNDMLFWAKNAQGYTTDLRKAHVFTKVNALKQHQCRETDIPWPKDYIDARTRPAVDVQYVSVYEALKDTGITLIKPQSPKKERYKCGTCEFFDRREGSRIDTSFTRPQQVKSKCTNERSEHFGKWVLSLNDGQSCAVYKEEFTPFEEVEA